MVTVVRLVVLSNSISYGVEKAPECGDRQDEKFAFFYVPSIDVVSDYHVNDVCHRVRRPCLRNVNSSQLSILRLSFVSEKSPERSIPCMIGLQPFNAPIVRAAQGGKVRAAFPQGEYFCRAADDIQATARIRCEYMRCHHLDAPYAAMADSPAPCVCHFPEGEAGSRARLSSATICRMCCSAYSPLGCPNADAHCCTCRAWPRVVVGSLVVTKRLLKYRMWDGGGYEIHPQPSGTFSS